MEETSGIISPGRRHPSQVWRDPACFLAFGLGSGLAPKAPGTFGTLAAVPLYFLLAGLSLPAYLGVTATMFAVGILLCERTTERLGVHDHPAIVWDEFVGYLLTMAAAPAGLGWALAGFVLFRLFDIVKPWPIGWVDRRVSGGFGIMVDDALAAVPAWCILQAAAVAMA